MKKQLAASLISSFLSVSSLHAETPCDFKGVSVGDTMTPAAIMAEFGVTDYKINPSFPSWDDNAPAIAKYGLTATAELNEWNIGPFCDDDSCRIPFGVGIGNDNTPVTVFVAFHHQQVTEIDVSFSQANWDEVLPILDLKYGGDWDVERDPNMEVKDLETKHAMTIERVMLTHKKGGHNIATHDACQIWATNLDVVFQHHDPLGPLHSQFVIKLISKNF